MGWSHCLVWFLCLSVRECWLLPSLQSAMHGEVQPPNYPQPYHPNQKNEWDLWAPEGYQIELTLTHLDIRLSTGCHEDSLTIFHDQKVLGKFCGRNSKPGHSGRDSILSQGNRLTLIFQTSNSTPELHQHTGFSAIYKAIDMDECSNLDPGDGSGPLCSQICVNTPGSYHCSCHSGYKLHSDEHTCLYSCGDCVYDKHEGHLSSPWYPGPSPPILSCKYIISVEPKFTITLNFTNSFHILSVDTQSGLRCLHHWLQITLPDREPMKLCGGKSPGVIDTNSSTVRLDYHTDNEGLSHGWSLDFMTYSKEVKCPFPGNVAKGRVTPVLTEYFYRDNIHVTCRRGYRLMMDGQKVKTFSAMCQSDGLWQHPLPYCQIIDCGEPKPLLNGGMTFMSGFKSQYQSVVQYHCNEPFYSLPDVVNVSFTCEADGKWKSNHSDATPTCTPVCGKPTKLISTFQRTVGDSTGPGNTIPWHVLLKINGRIGGGMVISDRWIMTAAHVLTHDANPVSHKAAQIHMGVTDFETQSLSPAYATSIHVHPEYNNSNGIDYNNDIALIKLLDPITFNSSVMPICLPAKDAAYVTDAIGLVSGFTITGQGSQRILTNRLKYVHLLLVEQETCTTSVNELKKTMTELPSLTHNMVCAGHPGGGKDSCHGDSGSTIALRDDGQFWAAGIVSWRVGCGLQGTYGVYTRVTNYLDWIDKTMQEN